MIKKGKIRIKFGIRSRLLIAMVGLIVVILLVLTYIQMSSQQRILQNELSNRIAILKNNLTSRGKMLSDYLARFVENEIASYNLSNIAVILRKATIENQELKYAILMDISRMAFIHTLEPDKRQKVISDPEDIYASNQYTANINEFKKDGKSFVEFIVPLNISGTHWGWLRLGFSQDILNKEIVQAEESISIQLKELGLKSIITASIFIILAAGIVLFISNRLSKPIEALTHSAHELANGNFEAAEQIDPGHKDEIGVLSNAFIDMTEKLNLSHKLLENYSKNLEGKVERRTRELTKANKELKQSQEQLVQSEKMASLGQLVAGIAHEINTPIGVGVTTSTHFLEMTRNIMSSFENNKMTRSALNEYFITANQSCELIFKNLKRTSELIKSFKMVSADQASHEKRRFNIKAYLHDIIASLSPELKKTKLEVLVNCDDFLEIDSYPGAFAQIFTNFIINSFNHAYDEKVKIGTIKIEVFLVSKGNIVMIKYSDNGKGISEKNMKKIFDPFFTTNRSNGGTGLGLHVVYNIVTQTLNGVISCDSVINKGTTFNVEIPINIAQKSVKQVLQGNTL